MVKREIDSTIKNRLHLLKLESTFDLILESYSSYQKAEVIIEEKCGDKVSTDTLMKLCELNITSEKNTITAINSLAVSFMCIYRKEEQKLAYHINIVDLLGAHETAHSRIFEKLLKQNNNKQFEILKNFIFYVSEINSAFQIVVRHPYITAEKDRIDVLIQDDDYAIIVENKIHNAVDQQAQLSRYIDIVKGRGYREEQIYVLYLPRDDSKSPSDNSWGEYKQRFEARYLKLSYRDDILPWLSSHVLPNIKFKDVFLRSCIEQYIDHLEGLFSQRKTHINMNRELQKHIAEAVGLSISAEENHAIIVEKLDELNKVRDQLDQIKSETEKTCWNEWKTRLHADFPNLEVIGNINDDEYPKVGVKFDYKGKSFSVLIEKETNIYYGIGRHYSSEVLDDEIKSLIEPLMCGFKETQWWYGWRYTSFKNGYSRLSALINDVSKLLNIRLTH